MFSSRKSLEKWLFCWLNLRVTSPKILGWSRRPESNSCSTTELRRSRGLLASPILLMLLALTLVFGFLNKNKLVGLDQKEVKDPGVCGNTLCEPNLGESKESCPKDCLGGN